MRLPAGVIGVALNWHAASSGTARGEARKGFVLLEVAVPSLLNIAAMEKEEPMGVIIGMDPHKRSATIEVIDDVRGAVLAAGRFGTDKVGYQQMLTAGRRLPGPGLGGGGLQRHRQTPRAPARA